MSWFGPNEIQVLCNSLNCFRRNIMSFVIKWPTNFWTSCFVTVVEQTFTQINNDSIFFVLVMVCSHHTDLTLDLIPDPLLWPDLICVFWSFEKQTILLLQTLHIVDICYNVRLLDLVDPEDILDTWPGKPTVSQSQIPNTSRFRKFFPGPFFLVLK